MSDYYNSSFLSTPKNSPQSTMESPLSFIMLDSSVHFQNSLIAMIIINALISITAFGLNLLIVVTLLKTASLWVPSNVLLLGLAFSDLGVAVINEPAYCCYLVSLLKKNLTWTRNSKFALFVGSNIFFTASLFTVTAITIDRFLAIKLHLRYQSIVTSKRAAVTVTSIYIGSIFVMLGFLFPSIRFWYFTIDIISIFLLIVFNVPVMIMISKAVRQHQSEIHAQEQIFNITRYKRTINTMYYVIALFVLCFLPYWIFSIVSYSRGRNNSLDLSTIAELAIYLLTVTLVNLSCVFNPILYCWRIQGMRTAATQLLQKIWRALKGDFPENTTSSRNYNRKNIGEPSFTIARNVFIPESQVNPVR